MFTKYCTVISHHVVLNVEHKLVFQPGINQQLIITVRRTDVKCEVSVNSAHVENFKILS